MLETVAHAVFFGSILGGIGVLLGRLFYLVVDKAGWKGWFIDE